MEATSCRRFSLVSSLVFLLLALGAANSLFAAPSKDSFRELLGERFSANPSAVRIAPEISGDALHRWNQIAINASGLDHTPVAAGEIRTFGEQLGPGRSSRAMAIVHVAMADVVSAIRGGFTSYTGVKNKARSVSMEIAISQAAHDTLVALYPSQTASFDMFLEADLLRIIANKQERGNAQDLGRRIAAAILALRANDGSQTPEPQVGTEYLTSDLAGHWRQDPISLIPIALGAHWGECTPFVLQSSAQYRAPAPPSTSSAAYTTAFNEAKNLGGDGTHTATQRTAEQTFIGVFWAYDGTPSLCAPPRLYNRITVQIATQKNLGTVDLARLLALVNVAIADAGFSAWESKYHWDFWRPVGGIRESDAGTGPSGSGDGNNATIGDPDFMPLGAPADNLTGPNFTPPFPAYPSGHATFGGALFQTLRRFFGTDRIGFTFVSEEFNGTTHDNTGALRPYMPRYFTRLSEAEEENGQSRIYLGVHWAFDKTAGIKLGNRVANYVFDRAFTTMATHGPGVPLKKGNEN
ncbi:MAG: vanadium-dependent haloperoxidase [Verrucomicrobiota bacterium]|nr:vanadium-dependent haloperoxidase [Verrucomicrobiota bacterium]